MDFKEAAILVLVKAGQQSPQGTLDVTNRSDRYRMSPAYMCWIDIDLDDRSLTWIELAPGEIRSEQEQHITVQDGMIAGASADDTRHPDIVRIIIFEKILATCRVSHGCFQASCCGD